MRVKGLTEASPVRIGRVIRDVWFIVETQGKAPAPNELEMICYMNGISCDDVCKLMDVIANTWEPKKVANTWEPKKVG